MATSFTVGLYGSDPDTITNEYLSTYGYWMEDEVDPPIDNGEYIDAAVEASLGLLLPEQYKKILG